ncbi:Abi-alpha family protein [Sphingobacterium deserti]|uniref:DUF4393 domain-containing protein n=1 Tax=Sphingobacterium deserti TaxID=1229276 RepID=A0A0B8T9D4_9SPHI|nr:Abi-alpha family protein [Sphingobacterium deserti]KGE14630.1 hypothetical protein DI53_1659 [Sphingobacterium deserti]
MSDEILKDISEFVGASVVSKELLKKSENLLTSLFGPSFKEFGGLLSDNVKLRRFKNQVKIFTEAEEFLKNNNIEAKSVNLKVLAPLIEFSSLEEDESLQKKWSNLTVNILRGDSSIMLQQNSITVLNKISTEDAALIDMIYDELPVKKNKRFQKQRGYSNVQKPEDYPSSTFTFSVKEIQKRYGHTIDDIDLCIANLISVGLLKWDTDVEVTAQKSSDDPDDTDIDVDINVYNDSELIITRFGEKFVELCREVE